MKVFRFLAVFLLILPAAVAAQECAKVVWADEFNGNALDASKWSHQLGDGCPELCGWGNNELQYYQAENAIVRNGTLRIVAREEQVEGKNYTSARIRSLDKGDFTFGRFEARIRMSVGQGLWPAFWMLPTEEVFGGWPQSGEIDIMENVGHERSTVHGTIHYGDPWPNNSFQGTSYDLNQGAFTNGFHTFAVERSPGVIRWFVDDLLYATKTTSDLGDFNWPFDERFHFIFNLAVGGNWPGNPDDTTVFPQQLEVDYVRVYDRGRPYLRGQQRVVRGEIGTVYELVNPEPGSQITWQLPAGNKLVSGQGSRQVNVNWGANGGDIKVFVRSACGRSEYTLNVAVDEPDVSLTMPNQLALEILSPSRILATWNDRSDDETSFELIGRNSQGWQKIGSAGVDGVRAVSLPMVPRETYEVRVRARDGARVSVWSPKRVVTMPATLPRPNLLIPTPLSPTEVQLDWIDTSRGEESFEMDLRLVPEAWEPATVLDANVERAVLTGLTPGATYMFRLRARKEGALSEWRRAQIVMPTE